MGLCAWMDAVGIDGMRLDQWMGGWMGDWGWIGWFGWVGLDRWVVEWVCGLCVE